MVLVYFMFPPIICKESDATDDVLSEFSESLEEYGSCLLEKTSLNDDEESGELGFSLCLFFNNCASLCVIAMC